MSQLIPWQRKLLFSCVVLATFLLSAEIVVRSWARYFRESYERFDSASGTLVLVPGRHRAAWNPIVVNRDGFVGAELEDLGPEGVRIVALGDSNTFGGGDGVHTYPARLERILKERRSLHAAPLQVINAGIQGLDSELALARLRSKVVPLRPDVITIYIGWNDLMKFDPTGQAEHGRMTQLSRGIDSLWLVKGIRKAVFFYLRPIISPPATGPSSRSGRFTHFTPAVYRDNLVEMIEVARSSGAGVAVATLPTVVRLTMSADDLRKANVYFPYFPAGYAVGDFLDLVESYNRAIREVGDGLGVPVIPLDRVFAAREDFRQLFYDTMHPTDAGQELIADEFSRTLIAASLVPGDEASGDAP